MQSWASSIKISSNLNKLCVKQAFVDIPFKEQQLLEALTVPYKFAPGRQLKSQIAGGLAGAAAGGLGGALIGAPMGSLPTALPGAAVGGFGGAALGPLFTESLAKARTSEGETLSKDPELMKLIGSIRRAQAMKSVGYLLGGTGLGALAGLPFGGAGAIPGAAGGLLVGAVANALTKSRKAEELAGSDKAKEYKQKLQDLLNKPI